MRLFLLKGTAIVHLEMARRGVRLVGPLKKKVLPGTGSLLTSSTEIILPGLLGAATNKDKGMGERILVEGSEQERACLFSCHGGVFFGEVPIIRAIHHRS